jgi:hypothetical protein
VLQGVDCGSNGGEPLPPVLHAGRYEEERQDESLMSEDSLHGSVVVEPMAFLLRHQSRLPLAALASLVVLKLGVLLTSGPTMLPDSTGYIAYADAILNGSFRHVDLAGTAQPVMLTRIIGFPALIAAGKIIAGQYWAWAVILLQFAVSSCATVLL